METGLISSSSSSSMPVLTEPSATSSLATEAASHAKVEKSALLALSNSSSSSTDEPLRTFTEHPDYLLYKGHHIVTLDTVINTYKISLDQAFGYPIAHFIVYSKALEITEDYKKTAIKQCIDFQNWMHRNPEQIVNNEFRRLEAISLVLEKEGLVADWVDIDPITP